MQAGPGSSPAQAVQPPVPSMQAPATKPQPANVGSLSAHPKPDAATSPSESFRVGPTLRGSPSTSQPGAGLSFGGAAPPLPLGKEPNSQALSQNAPGQSPSLSSEQGPSTQALDQNLAATKEVPRDISFTSSSGGVPLVDNDARQATPGHGQGLQEGPTLQRGLPNEVPTPPGTPPISRTPSGQQPQQNLPGALPMSSALPLNPLTARPPASTPELAVGVPTPSVRKTPSGFFDAVQLQSEQNPGPSHSFVVPNQGQKGSAEQENASFGNVLTPSNPEPAHEQPPARLEFSVPNQDAKIGEAADDSPLQAGGLSLDKGIPLGGELSSPQPPSNDGASSDAHVSSGMNLDFDAGSPSGLSLEGEAEENQNNLENYASGLNEAGPHAVEGSAMELDLAGPLHGLDSHDGIAQELGSPDALPMDSIGEHTIGGQATASRMPELPEEQKPISNAGDGSSIPAIFQERMRTLEESARERTPDPVKIPEIFVTLGTVFSVSIQGVMFALFLFLAIFSSRGGDWDDMRNQEWGRVADVIFPADDDLIATDVRVMPMENASIGDMFLISGFVQNNSVSPVSKVAVKIELGDKSYSSFAGTVPSMFEIADAKNWTQLESRLAAKSGAKAATDIQSGKRVPFAVLTQALPNTEVAKIRLIGSPMKTKGDPAKSDGQIK
jgi:hypothetical protein